MDDIKRILLTSMLPASIPSLNKLAMTPEANKNIVRVSADSEQGRRLASQMSSNHEQPNPARRRIMVSKETMKQIQSFANPKRMPHIGAKQIAKGLKQLARIKANEPKIVMA